MAEEEQKKDGEAGANPEAEPVVEHVTHAQWLAMFALTGAIFYLYVIWPRTSDSTQHLKEPTVYLEQGRKSFELAHTKNAFPRDIRLNTFDDVSWQFSQARRAGGNLLMEDLYKWGYASLQVAEGRYPGSRYAMIKPLERLVETRKAILAEKTKLEADNDPMVVRERMASLPVHPAKVAYTLAQGYMAVERYDKAIDLLKELQTLRLRFEQSQRFKGGQNAQRDLSGLMLGATPYHLQQKELFQTGWMLGKALDALGQRTEATQALDAYLVSTKPMGNAKKESLDREIRFQALNLLSQIHFKEVHRQEQLLRKLKGQLEQGKAYAKTVEKRKHHLTEAHRRLMELFSPEYKVYGLDRQHLMLVEVATKLGLIDQAYSFAKAFTSPDPHLRNEMKLWEVKAWLQKDPRAPVEPILDSIANDNTRDHLKLAALVMLGEVMTERGYIDRALGQLVPGNENLMHLRGMGCFQKAATDYEESAFDENPFIDKFGLVQFTMERARLAERNGKEDLAIRLYRFLLKEFTVRQGSVIQGIAKLQRLKGRALKEANPERDQAPKFYIDNPELDFKHWFKVSALSFLKSVDDQSVPFEKATADEGLFQAGESFFEGGFYSDAYETYGRFIETRPEDSRITKARHKKGVSALYRAHVLGADGQMVERKDRFGDARAEFIANISKGIRPQRKNGELPLHLLSKSEKDTLLELSESGFFDQVTPEQAASFMQGKRPDLPKDVVLELIKRREEVVRLLKGEHGDSDPELARRISHQRDANQLKQILTQSEMGSRDIWAYNSLLELGNAYYAEHRYPEANMVYDRIRNDGRFAPRSEVWRKAAYAQVKMKYDEVIEKEANPNEDANWEEAIRPMEDLLMLYDLKTYDTRFSMEDEVLYNTFQRDNAHVKFLLARALLYANRPNEAAQHAEQLLNPRYNFDLSLKKTEDDQVATEQKTQALLAEAYYDMGRFSEAMEQYRRAHDRNLKAAERPFYSLGIVDCLIGMNRIDEAVNRLKRIKWEFEEFFKEDSVVLKDKPGFSKEDWISLVDQRINQLQDSAA